MKKTVHRNRAKSVLRLPDLEHAKSAVLNSLGSPESRRSYEFAIRNFVHWYCSEPRLGNWLTAEQSRALMDAPRADTLRGRRDRGLLAVLLGCGLRRSEVVHLTV